MKKYIFTAICLIVSQLLLAQDNMSGVVTGPSREGCFNARDYVLSQSLSNGSMAKGSAVSEVKKGADGYRWIDRISNLPEYMQDFYTEYAEICGQALNKQSNWLTDPTLATKISEGVYGVKVKTFTDVVTFSIPSGSTNDDIATLAYNAIKDDVGKQWDEANTFFNYMCLALTYDYPQAFWVDSYFRWNDLYSYKWSWNSTTGRVTYTHDIYFVLLSEKNDFDYRRNSFSSESAIFEGIDTYNQSLSDIIAGIPANADTYKTVTYFNDWLTSHNYYNTYYDSNTNSKLAWSPISALEGLEGVDAPVCEGYSRAFKVLCDKMNIPCQVAVGFAKASEYSGGESHMWNEVMMDDEYWYAMDVTWNDPYDSSARKISGYENTDWSLVGSNTVCQGGLTFSKSHPTSITWDISDSYMSQWECDLTSRIAEDKYVSPDDILPKCPSPEILFADGKITAKCEVSDAVCHLTCNVQSKNLDGNNTLEPSLILVVKATATADNYSTSDATVKEIPINIGSINKADVNGDGRVDILDVNAVIANIFGK